MNKEKILVVDDNKDAARMLGKLLERMKYDVRVLYSSLEAFDAVLHDGFDAAILDIAMPNMDGHELARGIRKKCGKDILLIAITGYGQDSDKEKAKKAGFDYHVTKPVSLQQLIGILEKELHN